MMLKQTLISKRQNYNSILCKCFINPSWVRCTLVTIYIMSHGKINLQMYLFADFFCLHALVSYFISILRQYNAGNKVVYENKATPSFYMATFMRSVHMYCKKRFI